MGLFASHEGSGWGYMSNLLDVEGMPCDETADTTLQLNYDSASDKIYTRSLEVKV